MPFAFWLIGAHKPKVFVELGTHHGVSYFAFCQAVERSGVQTRCFAVDSWKGDEHAGFYGDDVFKNVKAHNDALYSGFSRLIKSSFDAALEHFSDGQIDLLHIDGYHTLEAVQHDFESWLPKLSDRGLVVLHDTNVREREFGVYKFFEAIRAKYPVFEFVHGHGLGVIGVGAKQNDAVKRLFAAEMHEDLRHEIHDVFARLGRGCADSYFVSALDTKERKYKRDIEGHKKSIDDLKAALEKAKQDIKAQADQIASGKKSLGDEVSKSTRLAADLERYTAGSRAVESLQADTQTTLAQLETITREQKENARRLDQQLVSAQQECAVAQDRLLRVQNELDKRIEDFRVSEATKAAAQARVAELEASLAERNDFGHRMEQELKSARQEAAVQLEKSSWLQSELDKRASDIREADVAKAEALTHLAQISAQLTHQRELTKHEEEKLALAQREAVISDGKIVWLQDELEKRYSERKSADAGKADAEAKLLKAEAIAAETSSIAERLQQEVFRTQQEKAGLEVRFSDLRDEMENRSTLAQEAALELRHRLAQTESALAQRSLEAEQVTEELTRTLQLLANSKDELLEIKASRDTLSEAASGLGAHAQMLARELDEARIKAESDLAAKQSEFDRINSELHQALEQATASREALENSASSRENRAQALAAELEEARMSASVGISRKQQELDRANSELGTVREALSLAKADFTRADKSRGELERVASGLKEHVALLMADVDEAKSAAKAARKDAKDIERNAEGRRKSLEKDIRQRFTELAILTKHVGELKNFSQGVADSGHSVDNDPSVRAIAALLRDRGWSFRSSRARQKQQIALIKASGLFDSEWYLKRYNDVAKAGMDPALHYLQHGAKEGRSPNSSVGSSFSKVDVDTIRKSGLFDERYYYEQYPDLAQIKMDPIEHYLLIGSKLKRNPSPKFNTAGYLSAYGDVKRTGMNPLLHYVRFGRDENRDPNP